MEAGPRPQELRSQPVSGQCTDDRASRAWGQRVQEGGCRQRQRVRAASQGPSAVICEAFSEACLGRRCRGHLGAVPRD